MAKKLSVQTVAATAKTMKKVAPSLSAVEERALRMRIGLGLAPSERLEQKASPRDAVAAKLAQIELMAFRSMGQKIYGIGRTATARPALAVGSSSRKDKIIKALRKR
jgi:hypothetical protein